MSVMRRPKPLDAHTLRPPGRNIDYIPLVPERDISPKSPHEGKCHDRHHRPNPPNDPRRCAVEPTINHCPSVDNHRAFYFTLLRTQTCSPVLDRPAKANAHESD